MKKTTFFLALLCVALSCTKDKTDYEAEIAAEVPIHNTFEEAYSVDTDGFNISIEALNGAFYTGYNEIRIKITQGISNELAEVSAVTLEPTWTSADGETTFSTPHQHELAAATEGDYLSGFSVFTTESDASGSWSLDIGFRVGGVAYRAKTTIAVGEQANQNLNMTRFTGNDGQRYIIALIAPQQPQVGENELIAGIFRYNAPVGIPDDQPLSYSPVIGYTLLLDPRMPEPSMGNHSSPNNKDLTQQNDGLYHGIVNYTMTGNWTLNFMLLDEQGQTLKGTVVPPDFTPGVEGAKSDLHIDILF